MGDVRAMARPHRSAYVVILVVAALVTCVLSSVEATAATTWSIVKSPNPAGSSTSYLTSASCTGATACTAVGYAFTSAGPSTLVEKWNGAAWHIVGSPDPSGTLGNYLSGVSCTGSSACIAVGYSTRSGVSGGSIATLAEKWNGTTWSVVKSPNLTGAVDNYLVGVSCTGATACTAVGNSDKGGPVSTLVETWNGTTWSIVKSPNPAGASSSQLTGVSCSGLTACTAVGYSSTGAAPSTLVEKWNGTAWHIVGSPNPSGASDSYLSGVSCTGSTACTAVGYSSSGGVSGGSFRTLAEKWNGTTWSIVKSPNPSGALDSYLFGAWCSSAAACTAVGSTDKGGSVSTLIESWNGKAWSILKSPNPTGALTSQLSAVSCIGATACTAVGYSYSGGKGITLVEQT